MIIKLLVTAIFFEKDTPVSEYASLSENSVPYAILWLIIIFPFIWVCGHFIILIAQRVGFSSQRNRPPLPTAAALKLRHIPP